jgi:hypothetical protein
VKIRVVASLLLLLSLATAQERRERNGKIVMIVIAVSGSQEVVTVNGHALSRGKDLLWC